MSPGHLSHRMKKMVKEMTKNKRGEMKKHAAALFINVLNAHPATMTAVKSSASGFKFLYDFFLWADERCCTRLQSHKMMVLISFFFFFFYLLAGADDLLWCIRKGITVFLGQLFYNSVGTSSLLPREVTRCCRILFGAGRKYITHGRWYVLRLCVLGRSSSYSSSSSSYSSLE